MSTALSPAERAGLIAQGAASEKPGPLTLEELTRMDASTAMYYAGVATYWRRHADDLSAPGLTRRQRLARASAAKQRVVDVAVRLEVRLQRLADQAASA